MKKTVKHLLSIGLLLVLVFGPLGLNAFAEPITAVASSPFQVHQGETFTTTIYIPDDANIVDFDITLRYDTDKLTLVSAEENEDCKGTLIFNDQTPGVIVINYTRTNKNVTSYLPLLDLTFTLDGETGVGVYDCLSIEPNAAYVAHRLNASGGLDVVDFSCEFSKLTVYEMGDVDLNAKVDIGDATHIRRHLARLTVLDEFQVTLADTYYDGTVDIGDAVALQRHLARLDVLYGNRVNITFYDADGQKIATKSVLYNGTLTGIPAVPAVEGYSGQQWSLSPTEYIAPSFSNLTKDLSVYAFYSGKINAAMEYYKQYLTNMYYSGDLPTNMSSDQNLVSTIEYQNGWRATLIWSSDCNYVLNSTTGLFTKPTYPQQLTLSVMITSRDASNTIDSEETISFTYDVPGMYATPSKASVEDFLRYYFTDETDGRYRVNYDVKLISKLNNAILPVDGPRYDNFEIRLAWYQNVNGVLTPLSQIKRTTSSQTNDYVAVATFNGKPLEDDGKIYIDDVQVTAIEQLEIKNHIIQQIAAHQGSLATDNTPLWNDDQVYHTTVTWETGAPDIGYVENNVIKLNDSAISGTTLPLNARVSYAVDNGETEEFILAYNLTVSCNNVIIHAPENMDPGLYKAIKLELEEQFNYSGDLTAAALANVKFVNLDLSKYQKQADEFHQLMALHPEQYPDDLYPDILSLRGLSYCKNLRTLNISGLEIVDGTMNQIATLSYLEAFIARDCGLDNLADGGTPTLRNAVQLKMLDLTNNNFTSLDSVFDENRRYGNLREVYLSNNRLTDINALERAPMLTYLSLANNGLTTAGTASIANYPYLLYLSLADNQIDSVEHLKNLKYLKELRLQCNNLTNINDLRRLVNLEILYLGHNQILDVGNLNTLTQLKVFYVNDNRIFDISALQDLTKLEAINVSNNRLTSLSVLNRFKSTLTEVYAENNMLTDFSFINGAPNLHILMLAGNSVEMAQDNMTTWLAALPEMEILTLSDIRLNDLSFLSSMLKLVRLDVANCGLHAMSGETSNIQQIADRYATLKVLNISDNDLSDNAAEILKLRNVTLLTVFYADNICQNLDAYTLTYSMTELKYISLENVGISSMNWLYKYNELNYVDLAGNKIADVDLENYLSNASIKTLDELYLDTTVPCSFANAYRVMDFNVRRLSLAGITVDKMEYMPYLDRIEYLNLDGTGLTNLTGTDPELADLYSIERYTTVKDVDVSHLETDISVLEELPALDTVYAVGTTDSLLFYEDNLHALQRLYNKGVTCYLYDKETVYEPVAPTEGGKILALLPDISCTVGVAADNVLSDNNPFLQDEINDFDITWTVSNSDNYEIANNHLAIKSYVGLVDEDLTVTATITVYPDQAPVSREFTIHTNVLRASAKYFAIDASGYSEQLTRDAQFAYDLTLKAAETEGFASPVKPVEDNIAYTYSAKNEAGTSIPYPNVLTVNSGHQYAINSAAPLNATVTIHINITHSTKTGEVIADIEQLDIPVTVASRTFTVTFVMDGGTIVDGNGLPRETLTLVEDMPIFQGLTYSKPGYTFQGWYTDVAFETLFSVDGVNAIMPSHDITLYAKWNPISFKVFFDANGGTVTTSSIDALSDVPIGTLPTPTRTYYTFDGWFTAKTGGDKVTAATAFTRDTDITLYAHWTLNSFVITFNKNDDTTDPAVLSQTSLRGYCGQALGTLPTPTRPHYNFLGWYTAVTGGDEVTASTVYTVAQDRTLYARWKLKDPIGWIKASELPSGGRVVSRKWSYTKTTKTESRETSLAGYTQIGSYWVKSGEGSFNYASFPSGFDTGNWYYTNWNRGALSAYETTTEKRDVSTWWAGWIYWHWMYDTNYANGVQNRAIYNRNATASANGFYYKFFGAFNSSTDYTYGGTGYTCNLGWANYIVNDRTSWNDCQGALRWFRFDYYGCAYTDYYKMFQYQKVENLESTTQVTAGTNGNVTISNVVEWVMYIPK